MGNVPKTPDQKHRALVISFVIVVIIIIISVVTYRIHTEVIPVVTSGGTVVPVVVPAVPTVPTGPPAQLTPAAAYTSSSYNNDEANFGPAHLLDGNFNSFAFQQIVGAKRADGTPEVTPHEWRIDMGKTVWLNNVVLVSRVDAVQGKFAYPFSLDVSVDGSTWLPYGTAGISGGVTWLPLDASRSNGTVAAALKNVGATAPPLEANIVHTPIQAQYIRIRKAGDPPPALSQVFVYGW